MLNLYDQAIREWPLQKRLWESRGCYNVAGGCWTEALASAAALARQGRLAALAPHEHDLDHHIHRLHRQQGLCPLSSRWGRFTMACGGLLDSGRDEVREPCCRRSVNRLIIVCKHSIMTSNIVTRASRARRRARTSAGARSQTFGGNRGLAPMGPRYYSRSRRASRHFLCDPRERV
jgi:hypothetical protein